MSDFLVSEETTKDEGIPFNGQYLYIDMPEGSLVIKRDDEGIVIDAFPPYEKGVEHEPVWSSWMFYEEFQNHIQGEVT
jgi:hypothetical protein